VTHNQTT
jgi:hypothetical protein